MDANRYDAISEIIEHYRSGGMIIVTDDDDRENEGDLMISSQCVTAESVSFMAQYGRGLICLPIERELAQKFNLPLMWNDNSSQYSTAFTVSVDAAEGTTTGISAHDRLKTIQTFLKPDAEERDLLRPGHLFPLISAQGGLKERRGHTEAAVELSRYVGHFPSGVICEIMSDDGTMTRGEDLINFSLRHNLPLITIEEMISYMKGEENEATFLPTDYGDFHLYHFSSTISDHMPHIALVHKEADLSEPVTTRLHSECLTGDLFGSQRCDCGNQLKKAMEIINKQKGILLYMRQEGRGIGLVKKMEAYRLQDQGADTVDANLHLGFAADERDYRDAGAILKKLGIRSVDLLTNNPEKVEGLESSGIAVRKRLPLETTLSKFSKSYMETKKSRMNHILNLTNITEDKRKEAI